MNEIRYYENYDLAVVDGYKFRRDKKTGYYLSSKKIDGKRKRLHIYIWEINNGPVPNDCQVHHIDENKYNNNLKNLMLLSTKEHLTLHGKENASKASCSFEHLAKIRGMAATWHRSEEGKKWHKKQYENNKEKFIKRAIFKCENCGKEYEGQINGKNKFCSNSCKSQYRRKTGIDNITRKCQYCGKEFTVNKYAKRRYCSKECSYKAVPRGGNTSRNR